MREVHSGSAPLALEVSAVDTAVSALLDARVAFALSANSTVFDCTL